MSSLFGIAAGGSRGFYSYEIDNSLRFDRPSNADLTRTPDEDGDRQRFTVSVWAKPSTLSTTSSDSISFLGVNDGDTSDRAVFYIGLENLIGFIKVGGANYFLTTSAVFRDVSAWYNFVWAVDTTQSTESNRAKLYVNGEQITQFTTSNYPPQNATTVVNGQFAHNVGSNDLGGDHMNGYLADFNFIDGLQLTPASFGETKSGVWIPKDTSGLTFGGEGFRLEFGDSSAIGDDTSGNGNDFTARNLEAVDVTLDSPTNNFATLNPLIRASTYGLQSDPAPTNGNLEIAMPGGTNNIAVSTFELQAPNKYRCSFELTSRGSSTNFELGICNVTDSINDGDVFYNSSGTIGNESGTQQSGLTSANTVGDIVEILVDLDANNVKFALKENGSSTWSALGTAENITSNLTNPIVWVREQGSNNINGKMDFGQLGYVGSDDENYLPMSTANLPEPSITPLNDDIPEDYFNTVLWDGNTSTQSITGVNFSPDWVWIKSRNASVSHQLFDVVRGTSKFLNSDNTNAEGTDSDDRLTSFDSDGFSLGDDSNVNLLGRTYVAWNWLAGTSFSNSAGANGADIASTGSVNTKSGFSIVSYTGSNSANDVVYHGIGTAPSLIIIKNRDVGTSSGAWGIFTDRVEAERLQFDTNDDFNNYPIQSFAANTFQLPTLNNTAWSAADDYIAYCFASIEGYSKIGIYIGNGNANGTFVYTGFRPAFVITKKSSGTSNWNIIDNHRPEVNYPYKEYNPANNGLLANSNLTESTLGTSHPTDLLSNGFKFRNTEGGFNGSATYLYMAFAEMPFKYANAR